MSKYVVETCDGKYKTENNNVQKVEELENRIKEMEKRNEDIITRE